MKVLITGAAGYIGSNLSIYLQTRGHEVVETDKIYRSPSESLVGTDLKGIDSVVHLAAAPGIAACEEEPLMAINDNVVAAENIFRLCYDEAIPVVFTSSQAAKAPRNTYGLLKSVCEQLGIRLNVNILRLANVYGGDQFIETKSSVIANFIRAKMSSNSITINGNGTQTRDFIHVDEVCRAIELCLTKRKIFADIGIGVSRSISTVAKMLNCEDIQYNTSGNKVGIHSNVADITAAQYLLGFTADDKLQNYLKNFW